MKIQNKDWWKSKTVWAAVAAAAVAILQGMGIAVPNEVYALLGALGIYGIRSAKAPIK